MAWVPFDSHKLRQYNGNGVNFSGADTLKLALTTVTYVPDQTNHDFFNDVTNEVTGTNYSAGGATLGTLSLAVTAHVLLFDSADITFAQSAGGFTTARIAIFYKSTGVASTSPLIAYYDLGADKGNVAGDLVLGTPSGIFSV